MSKRIINEKFKVGPDEYVKLFKNDNFELVVPLTFEASKKYGANAKWCTTTRCDDTMFNKHNEMGSLAYLIIKNPEIAQRLGNTKYGLFINKPDDNYLGGKYAAPSGIMMYGDNNSILSQSQVENEFDKFSKSYELRNTTSRIHSINVHHQEQVECDGQGQIQVIKYKGARCS